jgi:uncharacterized protein YyaL (SSP411 family)
MRTIPITQRNLRNLALMTLTTLWPPNTLALARNAIALRRREPWQNYMERSGATLETMADQALSWICRSQDRVGSGGVGDYQFHGWTTGYPEVTGYIIPTFWDYHRLLRRDALAQRAIRMADWELRIQKPEGGFESLYEGEGRPPVVFNTGQVIRGLTRTYEETGEGRYLEAAVRAADWIVANQDPDGSWTKAGYLGMKRTYDVYAAAALARLSTVTADDAYAHAATANCQFALRNQHASGWFDLCDNTPQGNATPSTHTLCYTIDGLIETGEALGEDGFIASGVRAARALMDMVESNGRLPGRFDRDWRPASRSVVLTGSAQLGLILTKLYRREGEQRLLQTALSLIDFLAFTQKLNGVGRNRRGGITGSFPIWGRYVPLKHASWATKFFLDHLLGVWAALEGTSPGSAPTLAADPGGGAVGSS